MQAHHEEKHFGESLLIRDVVIGMSDGLTVPFALAAGLSGAVATNSIIITAGVAEIIAGSIAMGLGGYLAGKTQVEHYQGELKREYLEVELIPDEEKEEIRQILNVYGIKKATQEALIEDLAANSDHWVNFMMRFELGLEKPNPLQASRSAIHIGLSYLLGGAIPLFPYWCTSTPTEALYYSSIVTLVALFAFGYTRSKLIGQKPFLGAIKLTAIGALAASAAFLVARLIQ